MQDEAGWLAEQNPTEAGGQVADLQEHTKSQLCSLQIQFETAMQDLKVSKIGSWFMCYSRCHCLHLWQLMVKTVILMHARRRRFAAALSCPQNGPNPKT